MWATLWASPLLWPLRYVAVTVTHAWLGLLPWVSDTSRLMSSLQGTCRRFWLALRSRPRARWLFAASSLGLVCLSLYFMPSESQAARVTDYYGSSLGALLRRDNVVFLAALFVLLAGGKR